MSAKELILDFVYLILMLLLIGFCVFFFIAGDRFAAFTELLKAFVPMAFIGIVFIIKLKLNRRELKKRKKEENLEIILHLTFMDKLYTDIINFSIPAVIFFFPFIFGGEVGLIAIFQALFAYLIFYLWQRKLFNKL